MVLGIALVYGFEGGNGAGCGSAPAPPHFCKFIYFNLYFVYLCIYK